MSEVQELINFHFSLDMFDGDTLYQYYVLMSFSHIKSLFSETRIVLLLLNQPNSYNKSFLTNLWNKGKKLTFLNRSIEYHEVDNKI